MSTLAAFGLGGLTACILMRIAISIAHDIHDRHTRCERSHGDHRAGEGGR